MKIGIFIADSNGGYPVPASKGGAVSTLVESLVQKNNMDGLVDMSVVSFYEPSAYEMAKKYSNITFIWVKPWKVIKLLDRMTFAFVKHFTDKKALSYKSIWSLMFYVLKSSQFLKRNSFDKVILENNIPLAWCIKLSQYGGDFFYHFHNIPRINAKANDVFNQCKGFLCVSDFVGKSICSPFNPIGPIDTRKIKILYNCIDTNMFRFSQVKRNKVRNNYGINDNSFVVIFAGRLSEEKGIDILLDALKRIEDDYTLLIVGSYLNDTNYIDDYQRMIQKKADDLKQKVIWTGFIKQSDIPDYYCAADVAVLPSMWDEPAGLTMIEALACGTPVITTSSGGIPEYMGDRAIVLSRDEKIIENVKSAILKVKNGEIVFNKSEQHAFIKSNFSKDDYLYRFVETLK